MTPVITMRLVAEERKLRTLELLLTNPVTETEVIVAKFLASLSLIVAMLALSLAYPVTLAIFGQPDWGPIYSGYLGLFLLGAALAGVGIAISSVAANQVVAALLSLSVFLSLWIIDDLAIYCPTRSTRWSSICRCRYISHPLPLGRSTCPTQAISSARRCSDCSSPRAKAHGSAFAGRPLPLLPPPMSSTPDLAVACASPHEHLDTESLFF
jgi:hypothetical protein